MTPRHGWSIRVHYGKEHWLKEVNASEPIERERHSCLPLAFKATFYLYCRLTQHSTESAPSRGNEFASNNSTPRTHIILVSEQHIILTTDKLAEGILIRWWFIATESHSYYRAKLSDPVTYPRSSRTLARCRTASFVSVPEDVLSQSNSWLFF